MVIPVTRNLPFSMLFSIQLRGAEPAQSSDVHHGIVWPHGQHMDGLEEDYFTLNPTPPP